MLTTKKFIFGFILAGLTGFLPTLALAQSTEAQNSFHLELNAASDTTAGSCRLTYVATNQSDIALSKAAFEVAIFNADGIVSRLIVLDLGALSEGKTKILQFDLAETPCGEVSRIVVNSNAACVQASDGAEIGFCMDALNTGSRTAIQFGI